jgi:hypothetical protein
MEQWEGPERRANYCGDHPNCVYRIELLETWRDKIDEKLASIQKLLVANLGGIIALLLSTTIGTIIWIAQH